MMAETSGYRNKKKGPLWRFPITTTFRSPTTVDPSPLCGPYTIAGHVMYMNNLFTS